MFRLLQLLWVLIKFHQQTAESHGLVETINFGAFLKLIQYTTIAESR